MTLGIDGEGQTIRLKGELDVATEETLTEALAPLLASGGDVILDLRELGFVDSSGVRAFARASKGLGDRGRLLLRDPGPAVQRVLDLMRLDTIPNIEIERTQES